MTKEHFVEAMKEWKTIDDDERACNEAFRKLDPDFNFFSLGRFHTLIEKVLKEATDDYADWISYYVYELEWGKKYKKGDVTYKGKAVPMSTLEELYDAIKLP